MNNETAVKLVHSTLEYLRYVGEVREVELPVTDGAQPQTKKEPTGEGKEINIVMMPDILLDFRSRYINPKEGLRGRICVVGGRAGRATCTLLHLIEDAEETFNCFLFTKTGNLGNLLFENEFTERDDKGPREVKRIINAKYLPLIIRHGNEPRCALRMPKIDDQTADRIEAEEPVPGEELSEADIESDYALNRILENAHVVYLASLNNPNSIPLFKYVYDKTKNDARIFVDLSRGTQGDFEYLDGFRDLLDFIKGKEDGESKVEGIFLPGYDQIKEQFTIRYLRDGLNLKKFPKKVNVPVIYYDNNELSYYAPDYSQTVQSGVDFAREDIAERFKAGVILAFATCQAIRTIANAEQRKAFLDAWGKELPAQWEKILSYGKALASIEPDSKTGYCSLNALSAGDDGGVFDPDFVLQMTEGRNRPQKFHMGPELFDTVLTLRYARRQNDWKKCQGLITCKTLKHECRKRGSCLHKARSDKAKAAILFDLDGTLIDSTKQRNQGLLKAMEVLRRALNSNTCSSLHDCIETNEPEAMLKFFDNNVYRNWKLFNALRASREEDFRQQWNIPAWYVSYLLLARDGRFVREMNEIIAANKVSTLSIDEVKGLLNKPQIRKWRTEYETQFERIYAENIDSIKAACDAFESVKMYPFREAWDILESLTQSKQFDIYVVSEGDPDTQWNKIQSTGLSRFFCRERILTTGDASKPPAELKKLDEATQKLEAEKKKLEIEIKRLESCWDILGKIGGDLEERQVQQDVLSRHFFENNRRKGECQRAQSVIQERLDAIEALQGVFKQMAEKSKITFYSAVIRSILRKPHRPLDMLKSFSLIMRKPSDPEWATKFAMIGDRAKTDIEPPLTLLPEPENAIVPIRILSGKYSREGEKYSIGLEPAYEVETLAQAKMLLFRKDTWENVRCIKDPDIFHCRIVDNETACKAIRSQGKYWAIEVRHIVTGLEMVEPEYEFASEVCCYILGECLSNESEAEKKQDLVNLCINWQKPADGVKKWCRDGLVKAAIISSGAINEFKDSIIKDYLKEISALSAYIDYDIRVASEPDSFVVHSRDRIAKAIK